MRRHFLSDLHLSSTHPELSSAFIDYCRGPALDADEIWLLGDIFEYWLGDDIALPAYPDEITALAELGRTRRLNFLPGNRDFLCAKSFAAAAQLRLHREPVLLDEAPRVLLLHGDTLCTDDRSYQRYRAVVHSTGVRRLFLRLPGSWREGIAQRLRRHSRASDKPMTILDANPEAAEILLSTHQAEVMIHGHTHRPARHRHPSGSRIVLPDWRPGQPESWQWLEQNGAEFSLRPTR